MTDPLQDPEFYKLSPSDQRIVLGRADPEFSKLSPVDQTSVLEKSAAAHRRPGFFESAGRALNPMPAVSAVTRAFSERSGKPLWEAFGQPQLEQFKKAGQQLGRAASGDISGVPGAVMYGAAGLVPGYGPAITSAVEEATPVERGGAGNLPGALGTLTGTALPAALGEVAGKGLSKVGGESIYKSIVKPSKKLPKETMEAVTQRGRALRTEASPAGMEEATSRIGKAKGEKAGLTSEESLGGQKTILIRDMMEPLNKSIQTRLRSNNPASAEPLMKFKQEWMERHGDENSFVSVSEAEKLLESSDAVQKENVFKEGAETEGAKLAEKALTTGQRREVGKAVPEVKPLNRAIHLDIELKKAINEAIKRDPQWLDHFGRHVLTAGSVAAGSALLTGHPLVAAGAAASTGAALLIRKAVQNPATMSRLAFALDKAGVVLPPAIKNATKAIPAATLGPTMQDMPPTRFEQP